ncbi:17707_t:CDS:10 [Acaulospora morrowiae]|uniref:17707_t:CDS:1 n=1 Tax=Acaulospora morrowiae TaxID=94023 RepID=A0A9N8ZGU3_9GLOM|nr:17707_t:CDS:10 [Acaulospora morrowiae]
MHGTRSKQLNSRVKEKPKQSSRTISPELILQWLKNDLGYRHRRNLLGDFPEKEITTEEIQKLYRNEFVPIFKFLVEHIKSSKEVLQYKKLKISRNTHHTYRKQNQLIRSHQSKRNKEALSNATEENYVIRKAMLDKKIAQITAIIEEGEMQTAQLITRISDIELQKRRTTEEIREKYNKIYMKKVFRESCRSIEDVDSGYRRLFEELMTKKRSKNEINSALTGIETTTTIRIKSICDKLKSVGKSSAFRFASFVMFNGDNITLFILLKISSQSNADYGKKVKIRFLIEDLIKTTSPKVILKSVSNVMKAANKELSAKSQRYMEKGNLDGSSRQVQRLLQKCREDHVSKFIEVEGMLNNVSEIKEKINKIIESTKLFLKQHYYHTPNMENIIVSFLEKKVENEAVKAKYNSVLNYARTLESRCQDLSVSSDRLAILLDRIVNLNEFTEKKQKIIQRLIFVNQRIRADIPEKSKEISRFLREVSPFNEHLDKLTKDLDCTVLRENEQFQNIDLKSALQVELNG